MLRNPAADKAIQHEKEVKQSLVELLEVKENFDNRHGEEIEAIKVRHALNAADEIKQVEISAGLESGMLDKSEEEIRQELEQARLDAQWQASITLIPDSEFAWRVSARGFPFPVTREGEILSAEHFPEAKETKTSFVTARYLTVNIGGETLELTADEMSPFQYSKIRWLAWEMLDYITLIRSNPQSTHRKLADDAERVLEIWQQDGDKRRKDVIGVCRRLRKTIRVPLYYAWWRPPQKETQKNLSVREPYTALNMPGVTEYR